MFKYQIIFKNKDSKREMIADLYESKDINKEHIIEAIKI